MNQTEQKQACKSCCHMEPEFVRCGRNSFYCMHPEAKTEIQPHRRIAQSRDREIPIKTAPKWCPLKQKARSSDND